MPDIENDQSFRRNDYRLRVLLLESIRQMAAISTFYK
jgi:hypothetical protein